MALLTAFETSGNGKRSPGWVVTPLVVCQLFSNLAATVYDETSKSFQSPWEIKCCTFHFFPQISLQMLSFFVTQKTRREWSLIMDKNWLKLWNHCVFDLQSLRHLAQFPIFWVQSSRVWFECWSLCSKDEGVCVQLLPWLLHPLHNKPPKRCWLFDSHI